MLNFNKLTNLIILEDSLIVIATTYRCIQWHSLNFSVKKHLKSKRNQEKWMKNVAIEVFNGVDEKVIPEIRLTKSKDG